MAEPERLPNGHGDCVRRHFLIVTYGIQSHINPCRVLRRRLVHLRDEDGSGDPASSRASSHGYDELIASHAADPAFEVTLPGKAERGRRISSWSQRGEAGKAKTYCRFFWAVRRITVTAYSARYPAH
jgi:hypothetical protein